MADNRFSKYVQMEQPQAQGGNRFAKYVAPEQQEAPSELDQVEQSFTGRALHGAVDSAYGLSQLVPRGVAAVADAVGADDMAEFYRQSAADMDQATAERGKEYDAQRKRVGDEGKFDGGRLLGNVLSPVGGLGVGKAAGLLPVANTLGRRLLQNAAIGGGSAALMPVENTDEKSFAEQKLKETGVGTVAGGVVPAVGELAFKGGKAIANLIGGSFEQLSKKGQRQIVARLMNQNASDPAAVIQNLSNVEEFVPNSPVTTGEAAKDLGLAGMQRGLRNKSNQNPFGDLESQQNTARNIALEDIAGDDATIKAAKVARDENASVLRDKAFEGYNNDPRMPRGNYKEFAQNVRQNLKSLSQLDLDNPKNIDQLNSVLSEYGYQVNKATSKSGKSTYITALKRDPVTDQPIMLSIRSGQNKLPANIKMDAIDLSKKDGYKLLADQILKSEPMKESVNPNYALGIAERRLMSPEGNLGDVETAMNAVKGKIANAINLGNPEYAYALRRDLANDIAGKLAQKAGGVGVDQKKYQRLAAGQVTDILASLDAQIEKAAPGYAEYMQKYQEFSKPINQMELLQDIKGKVQMNTVDAQTQRPFLSQPNLTRALRDEAGDLAKTLTPEQMGVLQNVEKDMTRSSILNARNVRPTGSDTKANMTSGEMIGKFLSDRAAERIPFGLGKMIQSLGKEDVNNLMIEAFRDPKLARELLVELRPELKNTRYSGAQIQKVLAQTIGSLTAGVQ